MKPFARGAWHTVLASAIFLALLAIGIVKLIALVIRSVSWLLNAFGDYLEAKILQTAERRN